MKIKILRISFLLLLGGGIFAKTLSAEQMTSTQKIIIQSRIEREAHLLAEEGRYEEAIQKYEEAMNPALLNREGDKATALHGIMSVFKWQNKFQEAQKAIQWFLKERPKSGVAIDGQPEIAALIESQRTNSSGPLYQYITYLRDKYKKNLPPHAEESIFTSKIIYAYDYIGDFDGGIAFCDEVLKYWEKKSGQDLHRSGNKNQYFLIRQAFEQDKAEGFKGCLEAKPGDACMGRATKALIQSDYFPW